MVTALEPIFADRLRRPSLRVYQMSMGQRLFPSEARSAERGEGLNRVAKDQTLNERNSQ